MPISIRDATLKDLPSLVDFQVRMARETEGLTLDLPSLRQGVDRVLTGSVKGKYYVAETDGKVIGCLMTTFEWSEWRNGNVLWIQSLYIAETFRGQGVFKSLYAHLKRIVDGNPELRGIRLYVDKNNTTAQRVYERLGMNGNHYKVFEWMKAEDLI